MSGEAGRLSLTDVARLAEVRLSAVSNWRARHAGFPQPRVVAGQELFDVRAVGQWLRERRIPRHRLKPDEPPGTSYGDRFLRNLDIAENAQEHEPRTEPNWEVRLWAARDALRGTHATAWSLEFLLGLVYVRTQRAEVWRSVAAAPDWAAMRELLAGVSLPVGPDMPALPVFPALTRTDDKSLLEAVRQVDAIDFGEDRGPESAGAQIGDVVLDGLERGMGRSGGHFTPPDVARCLVELVDPQPTDSVYDPFCGSGELLSAAAAHVERHGGSLRRLRVRGQTPHERPWLISRMNLALHGVDADLGTPGSALDVDQFPEERFSRVLMNPPFNVHMDLPGDRVWPFGEPSPHNANFAWLQQAASKLTHGGRAAVVMPNGVASQNDRSSVAIRKAMIEAGVVECVVSLPAGLFRFTTIPTMVWVLRGGGKLSETLFIDARALGEVVGGGARRRLSPHDTERIVNEYRTWRGNRAGFTGTAGFSCAVSKDEISAHDHVLTPGRYVGAVAAPQDSGHLATRISALRDTLLEQLRRSEELEAEVRRTLAALDAGERPGSDGQVVPLGKVCDVVPGPGSVPRSGHEPSWTPLVLPRNIRDNRIGRDNLDVVPPATAERLTRHRLVAGDIVTARAGTLGRYGLVRKEQTGWLLGPGCVRFRPDERVSPDYLIYYLGGQDALRWLEEHTSRAVIPNVNAPTLRKMPVWLPPLRVQQAIVEILSPFDAAASAHSQLSTTTKELRDLLVPMLTSPSTP